MADSVEMAWAGRALTFIESQHRQINSWRHGDRLRVPSLVQEAYLEVADVAKESGEVAERRMEFYMKGKHLATFIYTPRGRKGKLGLAETIYY